MITHLASDTYPELLDGPLRFILEHGASVALGDKLEIPAHTHEPGSTGILGPGLTDRTVRTLTFVVGDETKALASIFPL